MQQSQGPSAGATEPGLLRGGAGERRGRGLHRRRQIVGPDRPGAGGGQRRRHRVSAAAVEVKVDWTLLNSLGLDCNHLPDEFTTHPVHIETIHGNCFALSGMHVMSKLIDKWIWATFEPKTR